MIILTTDSIAAGATYPINQNGIAYELILATGRIAVKNVGKKFRGQFNQLPVGIQPNVPAFEQILLKNLESVPVAFSILVSDEGFRNNQVIIDSATNPDVTYPTQPIQTGVTNIPIADLSGQTFLDLDGVKWVAIFRKSIIISNTSTGTTLFLQKFGALTSSGSAVLIIPPGLPIAHNSSGNFSLNVGGGMIPAVVSEIYSAVKATT